MDDESWETLSETCSAPPETSVEAVWLSVGGEQKFTCRLFWDAGAGDRPSNDAATVGPRLELQRLPAAAHQRRLSLSLPVSVFACLSVVLLPLSFLWLWFLHQSPVGD